MNVPAAWNVTRTGLPPTPGSCTRTWSPVCTLNGRAIWFEMRTAAGWFCRAARLSVPTIALEVCATGVTAVTPGTSRRFAKADCCGTAALGVTRMSEPTTKRASALFSAASGGCRQKDEVYPHPEPDRSRGDLELAALFIGLAVKGPAAWNVERKRRSQQAGADSGRSRHCEAVD